MCHVCQWKPEWKRGKNVITSFRLEDGRKKGVKVHATIKSDPSTSMPIPIPIPP